MPLVPTPSAAPESRVLRVLTWVAFVIACITDFEYWLIIRVQESQPPDVLTATRSTLLSGAADGVGTSGTLRLLTLNESA